MTVSMASRKPAHTPRQRSTRPWAHLLIAALLAAILATAAPLIGVTTYGWTAIAVTTILGARLAHVDERTHTLPNRLTGSLATFGIIQAIGVSWWQHTPAPLATAASAAGVLGVAYAVLAFTGSCGFGDVKLAAALGLTAAPYAGFLTLYILPIAFMISAVRIMGRRLRGRGDRHPHGTSLVIAGLAVMVGAMLAGPALAGM